MSRLLKRVDLIIIASIVIVAVIVSLFIFNSEGTFADIYYKDTLIESVDLNVDAIVELEEYDMIIEVKDKKIAVTHADCPDKLCINTGYIENSLETIICLPNQVMIQVR